ncbi:MAG TPA: hypothetical protein VF170_05880, partial [Planctomycetaceae bacterium]
MAAPVAVSRSVPVVRRALAATFPDYRGRKVRVAAFDRPLSLDLSWSGGTVDKVALIDVRNGRIGHLRVPSAWARGAHDPVDCPPGAILVVRSWFCGVDSGVTFYVRPDDAAAVG